MSLQSLPHCAKNHHILLHDVALIDTILFWEGSQQDGIIRPFEGLRIIRGEHHLLKQRKVAIVHLHFDTAHAVHDFRQVEV